LGSYGYVSPERQAEIISALGRPNARQTNDDMASEIATKIAAILEERTERSAGIVSPASGLLLARSVD
jgi:hypothetical protein